MRLRVKMVKVREGDVGEELRQGHVPVDTEVKV